jgi:hypothetical protein
MDRAEVMVAMPVAVMMMTLPAGFGRGGGCERRDADGGDSGERDCSHAKHVDSLSVLSWTLDRILCNLSRAESRAFAHAH